MAGATTKATLSAVALLERSPNPTEAALTHLYRCGSYVRIGIAAKAALRS